MTATMAEINDEVAVNPDAQSAVTDFLDYTEYLPTDMIRSLTLIQQLDETYLNNAECVNMLTQSYGSLPSQPVPTRPNAAKLRASISRHLDLALNARESAYAEASRLSDLASRHGDRLRSILAKLYALPKPSSRDPTPQPQSHGALKLSRTGRKLTSGALPRLTLKAPKGPIASGFVPRPRHRRVTVPGEVQPPYDPDEAIASTEVSDWDSDPPSPVKTSETVKHKKLKYASEDRRSREPRETATYRKPTPPPDDAVMGGKWKPWTRLSEYEMYRLRKKMKKNHTWEPSEVMIKRELIEKGRGWENYYKAKAAAQINGTPFTDVDDVSNHPPGSAPPRLMMSKSTPITGEARRPRSLKRSESKREKRDDIPKDAAAMAAQEAKLAARRLSDISSAFRNLFNPFSAALTSLTNVTTTPTTTPGKLSKPKKRKFEERVSLTPSAEPEAQPKKKQKILPKPSPLATANQPTSATTGAGTIKIPPLKLTINRNATPNAATSTPASASRHVSASRQTAPKTESTPPPQVSRPPSRRSAAASVEPVVGPSTRASRRTSVTPVAVTRKTPAQETTPKHTTLTAASRRPKREAPGTVTQSSQDGGAAVSISKRTQKPNKKALSQRSTTTDPKQEIRTDIDGNVEIVDPDEDRYCVCNDVSWGEMICCELDEKVSHIHRCCFEILGANLYLV